MTTSAQASKRRFVNLARSAIKCRECFRLGEVDAPLIQFAQPRSIGPHYWTARLRVVVLLLNPGQSRNDARARAFIQRITAFRDGAPTLDELLHGQREAMPSWGNPPGRFGRFYLDGLGLSINDVAFANVAWCATAGNRYPSSVLRRCFHTHTAPLLALLQPDVVVASGRPVQQFTSAIQQLLPLSTVIPAMGDVPLTVEI